MRRERPDVEKPPQNQTLEGAWMIRLESLLMSINNNLIRIADAATSHSRLDTIITRLDTVIAKENHMAGELDALKTEVAETRGVMESAKALIDGFAAKLQEAIDAGGRPEDFEALRSELDTASTALAEAVAQNP